MFDKKEYLCLILDKETKAEIAEYTVLALDDYFAKSIAAYSFETAQRYQPNLRRHQNWFVDACSMST